MQSPSLKALQVLLIEFYYLRRQLNAAIQTHRIAPTDSNVRLTLAPWMLVLTNSFLEAERRLGSLSASTEIPLHIQNELRLVKRIVKPAVDRIIQWKDLREFRNTVLAHSFGGQQGRLTFTTPLEFMAVKKVPNSVAEIIVLAYCAILACKKILSHFKSEFEEARKIVEDFEEGISIPANEVDRICDIEPEVEKVKEAMLQLELKSRNIVNSSNENTDE